MPHLIQQYIPFQVLMSYKFDGNEKISYFGFHWRILPDYKINNEDAEFGRFNLSMFIIRNWMTLRSWRLGVRRIFGIKNLNNNIE